MDVMDVRWTLKQRCVPATWKRIGFKLINSNPDLCGVRIVRFVYIHDIRYRNGFRIFTKTLVCRWCLLNVWYHCSDDYHESKKKRHFISDIFIINWFFIFTLMIIYIPRCKVLFMGDMMIYMKPLKMRIMKPEP